MPKPGCTITSVEAVGKHLLVHFDDRHVLQTHLRMTGRWDVYRRGERWRKPQHLARAVIETEDHVAVCFSAPVVRIHRESATGASPSLRRAIGHLGPDLCTPDADLDEVEHRMADRQVRRIIVIDGDGRCVGMIAQADLARASRMAPSEVSPFDVAQTVERISEPVAQHR